MQSLSSLAAHRLVTSSISAHATIGWHPISTCNCFDWSQPCRCIDALRQLETAEGWAHPAVGLLALQAFLAAGDTQQAEVEAAGG